MPREIADIQDLLFVLDLKGVRYYEISGRRLPEDRPDDMLFALEIQQRHHESTFEIRFKLGVTHPQADYVIDVASIYGSTEPITFGDALATEFIEKVAVMAVYPFLREALASTAARLELSVPMLGLLKAGQFKVTATTHADAATASDATD